jgi:predicted Zn-dependent protease
VSWNRIIQAVVLSVALLTGVSQAKELNFVNDDTLIIQGLLFEEYRAYDLSREVFKTLYDRTGEEEYLFREIASALMGKIYIDESINRLKAWDEAHPDTLKVRRLLIPLYLTAKRVEEAKSEAEILLERSDKPADLDLAANPYLYTGDFKKAVALLEKVYKETSNENVLLRMSSIMDEYTSERTKAIQLLETHRRMNILTSNAVYFKLLDLYIKENDIDGLIGTYEALYEKEKDEKYLKKIIDAYAYKRDLDGAIAYLEKVKDKEADYILYELYKQKKMFDKAFLLTDKLYKQQKDPRWIAEKGILLFEKSKDKNDKKMIKDVVGYFEKAIGMGVDDSIYLNYYGYTLIDKDVDVKKGIKIIEDALVQQPDNTYYLDSLAWGYYKEQRCTEAFKLMKKVVEMEGLKEPEITKHWDAIQKCQ